MWSILSTSVILDFFVPIYPLAPDILPNIGSWLIYNHAVNFSNIITASAYSIFFKDFEAKFFSVNVSHSSILSP